MKRRVIAALTTMLLLAGSGSAAQASSYLCASVRRYPNGTVATGVGWCRFRTMLGGPGSDGTLPQVADDHGCGFASTAHPLVTGDYEVYTGALYAAYLTSRIGPTIVRCEIQVDGMTQSEGIFTGETLVLGASQATFTASDIQQQNVRICTSVTLPGEAETTRCTESLLTQIPPNEVLDVVQFLWDQDVYGTFWDEYDRSVGPAVCTQLAATRPGVPGVVDIREDGDVYVLGDFLWDCPPFYGAD